MNNKAVLVGVAALLGLLSAGAQAAGTKFYKCVDKNGNVQYVSVLTADCVDQQRAVQMEGSREAKKVDKGQDGGKKTTTKTMTPEEIEQQRHDDALLGTFTNEAEIDLARDRNLQQVNARISSIQMRLQTAQADLDDDEKEKANLQKAGKPVDKGLAEQSEMHRARLAKLQGDMAQAQAEAAAIKARYDADKKRFLELKSGTAK